MGVAMVAIAGDKSFQTLVWESMLTKDDWFWGAGYLLNIVAWVGALLLDCLVFVLWAFGLRRRTTTRSDCALANEAHCTSSESAWAVAIGRVSQNSGASASWDCETCMHGGAGA